MENSQFEEKRRFPRAQIRVEVLCYKTNEDSKRGTGVLHFYSKDISVGGIFLETEVALEAGSVVYLKFSVPGSTKAITTQARVITAEGKVVRVSDNSTESISGMGVEFQHLGYDEQKLIDDFVKGEGD